MDGMEKVLKLRKVSKMYSVMDAVCMFLKVLLGK